MVRQLHRSPGSIRAMLSVAIVFALSGILFTANARLAHGEASRQPEDFQELVRKESERGDSLLTQVEELQAHVDALTAASTAEVPTVDPVLAEQAGIVSGQVPVSGPGLRIVLTDAPVDRQQLAQVVPDDLVVHQQDIEGVINALWAGGAEAMTLQGQRVTSLTAFRCVGNVLSLHGRVYSPPYVVEVIGDPVAMTKALEASEPVRIYREYVDAVGLGWDLKTLDAVVVPASAELQSLDYAKTLPGESNLYK